MSGGVATKTCQAPDCSKRVRQMWCSEACRKRTKYGGTCESCGKKTDGSNGAGKAPKLCVRCFGESRRVWDRESILEALDLWVEHFGESPTVTDWNPAFAVKCSEATRREKRERYATGRWPSIHTVYKYFSSWNEMLRQAGREPNRRMIAKGTWTKEAIIAAIREWAEIRGRLPTIEAWTKAEVGVHPCATTVRNVFGTWGQALEAAGFEARPQSRKRRPLKKKVRQKKTTLLPPPPPVIKPEANTPTANRARVSAMRGS